MVSLGYSELITINEEVILSNEISMASCLDWDHGLKWSHLYWSEDYFVVINYAGLIMTQYIEGLRIGYMGHVKICIFDWSVLNSLLPNDAIKLMA